MAIWQGYGGGLRLQRAVTGPAYVWIEPGDVDQPARRMSADRAVASLITGDYVAVAHVDDSGQLLTSALPFMAAGAWNDGNKYPDGQWYVNVDAIGGIRFYSNWQQALKGDTAQAVPLEKTSNRCRIRVQVVADNDRCLAQTVSWELNTNRDTADITTLGEGFRKNMATMVSGSGTLDCFFSAGRDECETGFNHEKSVYLHRLALRQEIGATFVGVFLLKRDGQVHLGLHHDYERAELFYKCSCVITNVASSLSVEEIVHSRVEFVTTDLIQLLYGYPTDYLLQEGVPGDKDKILQENDSGILVDLPI